MASLNILIVEDNADCAAVAAAILVRAGHQVTACENGAVALQLCHKQGLRFDAAIMEAETPIMGGIETARLLREHEATANIPIVGLSAIQEIPDADVNIFKPYRKAELLQALEAALEARVYTVQQAGLEAELLPISSMPRQLGNVPIA